MKIPPWIVLHKKRGETPLECIKKWQSAHDAWSAVPASYAGRLDPMAEGKLLVLLGEECKRQSTYTKLDKEYLIEVLLDLKTDTGDILGLASYLPHEKNSFASPRTHTHIRSALTHEIGSYSRKYPLYSSKTVTGKPLFVYALEGTLDSIVIPEHIETLYRVTLQHIEHTTTEQLSLRLSQLLSMVPRSDEPSKLLGADFRQDAVRARWTELMDSIPDREFTILRLKVICGSGAYMRTLAERIGNSLGTTALALSINRTKIGRYIPLGPLSWGLGLWIKVYR